MAVLSRFKSFGSNRFSGLGQVDRPRRPAVQTRPAEPALAGTGSGRGARSSDAQNRSTS
jgi:preprotein translocase subunit SecD